MKRIIFFAIACLLIMACNDNKPAQSNAAKANDAAGDVLSGDSTIYGICGTGTMMHTLQLITDANDTINVNIGDEYDEDGEPLNIVAGGMMSGDRMAVLPIHQGNEIVAKKVINLTSLSGRWISLDKDFTLEENGRVSSDVNGESSIWTEWRVYNGQLILSKDTFDVINISADTLSLENKIGIYEYRRYHRQ